MDESHRSFGTVGVTGLVLVVATACVEESSALRVVTCGDLAPGRDVTEIRVSILDADRTPVDATVIPLVDCDAGEVHHMPKTTSFTGFDGETWVVAQGLHDGVEIVRGETRAMVEDGSLVGVRLSRACIGVTCAPGQGCFDGACRTLTLGQNPNICDSGGDGPKTAEFDCPEGGMM